MPELPEVETVVRELGAAGLVGRTVAGAHVRCARVVACPSVAAFVRLVRGRRLEAVARRGKYIVLALSGNESILVHLRMTGRLLLAAGGGRWGPHEHLRLLLDDGRQLRYSDPRKFGRWAVAARDGGALARLGPEPLAAGFSARAFAALCAGRRGMLKPRLLDQRFLAGLGNIYVDEALWEARLHPRRSWTTLLPADVARLHRAIRRVLRRGVAAGGTSLGTASTNFHGALGRPGTNQRTLRVFRRTGLPCPRCGAPIRRIVVAQRGTHVCERCQPGRAAGH